MPLAVKALMGFVKSFFYLKHMRGQFALRNKCCSFQIAKGEKNNFLPENLVSVAMVLNVTLDHMIHHTSPLF